MQNITRVAQTIAQHAANPPREKGQPQKVYEIGPHFERLTTELIRRHVILSVQEAEAAIAGELIQFKAFLPESLHGQFGLTAAKINEALHNIYYERKDT